MVKEKLTKTQAKRYAKNFVSYIKDTRSIPVRQAYLFGSYTKGVAHAWSDIDVCIISPLFKKKDAFSLLWKARRAEDVSNMVAPIGMSPERFQEKLDPLVSEIKKYGVEIAI